MRRALFVAFALSAVFGCRAPAPEAPRFAALPADATLIPARLRRLSNAEYEKAASELVGEQVRAQHLLPPDVRQDGFTINAAETVPAAHATRLASVAEQISHNAVQRSLRRLVPCSAKASDACEDGFVRDFAHRAFRRPPTEAEVRGLREL